MWIGESTHLLTLQLEPRLATASIHPCHSWRASSHKMKDPVESDHLASLWLETSPSVWVTRLGVLKSFGRGHVLEGGGSGWGKQNTMEKREEKAP